MTGNLFPDPTTPESSNTDPTTKPPLTAAPDRPQQLLNMLTLLLGLEDINRAVVKLEQDGKDPEDAQYTAILDNHDRLDLGPISTLLSRPKVQQRTLVRYGISPIARKTADWQEEIALIINGATTIVQTSESISSRVQEWATQYLLREGISPDIDTACINRDPYRNPAGQAHLVIAKLATWVSKNTTAKLTERQLASALRDANWTQINLMHWTEGRDPAGKGRGKRTSASYWQAPPEQPQENDLDTE